jgi:cytohesin
VRGSRVANLIVGAAMTVVPAVIIWGVLAWREHYFEMNHQPTAMSERAEALVEAAKNGDFDDVRSILRFRVDVNGFDSNGQPAMARVADARTATLLLDAGANPDLSDQQGYTPLMRAASEGRAEVVKVLVSRHVNLEARHPGDHETALSLAKANDREEIVRILGEAGAHP